MVIVAPGESIESAYKKLYKEMLSNGVLEEIEKNRYFQSKGSILRDKRRKILKTKKRRAKMRRKLRYKKI